MKEYDHKKIEGKWQKEWAKKKIYKTENNSKKKKYYVLDMFPYPSGVGLHVGHPKGYIGSDVFARLKRMQGYNVLHPMGYDAFGLPAEQYALEHNIHPRQAVIANIKTFEKQLSIIGLSYDWDRRVDTTDPNFYRWTQWIFLKLYNSWYNKDKEKAEPIESLIKIFEKNGDWKSKTEKEKQDTLMQYRLAYEGYSEVNWCPKLGTVLANDEVVDGKDGPISERGGHPVVKKEMRQWFMRITAYAERLLSGLERLDWSDHIKEIQRNWIGKSEGAEIGFEIKIAKQNNSPLEEYSDLRSEGGGRLFHPGVNATPQEGNIKIFTTRPDTLFGATYVVLAPEHPLVSKCLFDNLENKKEVENYIEKVKKESELERTTEDKIKTGVELKGVKAINPATTQALPVWIADYVLAGYGTGAIMAVPAHDERDFAFAKKFNLPIKQVISGGEQDKVFVGDGILTNSGKFDGMDSELAKKEITKFVGGKMVTKYKMRDAIFARQRYWGEPIPLYHDKNGIIHEVPEKDLPLKLPNVKSYQPTGTGESPLAAVPAWVKKGYETNTMPGWAGSSWYFLRFMDPKNKKVFADKKVIEYWKNVDMYVGGAEHATGHLLYARFWNKFLKDCGLIITEEPFKTLRNQGMILGSDNRKMSKRWGNVINPDDIVKTYGADTLRLYEMFLGPFEQSASWSEESIIGPRRFLEKIWRIGEKVLNSQKNPKQMLSRDSHSNLNAVNESNIAYVTESTASHSFFALQKLLHKTIKKVTEDIEAMHFNTAVSALMVLVNEMESSFAKASEDKKVRSVLDEDFKKFLQILAPFAPHISEELWQNLPPCPFPKKGRKNINSLSFGEGKGGVNSIHLSIWPSFDPKMIVDEEIKIAIQVNGKVRAEIMIGINEKEEDIKEKVLKNEIILKYLAGQTPKKVIYVKNKLVSVVV